MNLSTLRGLLAQLPSNLIDDPKRLKDKLLNQYITKIHADFVGVIQSEHMNPDERVQALKDLCAANWALINRTCLSYMAIPSIAVTEFLTEVAQFVAQEENKKGCGVVRVAIAPKDATDVDFAGFNSVCIRVREREDGNLCVLPSLDETSVSKKEALERVQLSGLKSGYLRLNKKLYYANIEKNLFVQLAASASALKNFDEHVEGLSSISSRSEASLFAKTLPSHPRVINGLYYGNQQHKTLARLTSTEPQLREFDETSPTAFSFDAIPAFSGDLAQAIEPMSALDVLMPGALIRMAPDSPNSNHFDTTLFYTHIQNEAGDELIPVRWLVEHRDYLTPEEYSRLTQHSDLTRAILASQQGYDAIASDTSTLLGQLTQLCRQLGVNDAHGGRGQADNAASGAYPAIIEFMTYYNALPATEVARIPAGVKAEIDLLLALTTDATQNVNATENLATCIATRKSSLQTAMAGHDSTLNQICISGEHKALLINTAQTNLESAKDDFIKALNEHHYTEGRDVLGLNTQLLLPFNTLFTIESLSDLNEFKTLTPVEIRDVLQSELLKLQIIEQLKTLENWVILSMEMGPAQLSAWTQALSHELAARFIINARDFGALLISLDVEKCRIICSALNREMSRNISSTHDLMVVLEYLNPEQRTVVLKSMQSQLPALIQSAQDLNAVLSDMSPEQCKAVLESMHSQLPALIRSGLDFGDLLFHLNPEQLRAVFDSLRRQLPALTQSDIYLMDVLRQLNLNQRVVVFELMKSELPNLIQSAASFRQIMGYLNLEERAQLYELMKTELLPNLVNLPRQFRYIMEHLTQNQRTEFYGSMKGVLPGIVKSYAFLEPMMNIPKYLAGWSGINRTIYGFRYLQSVLSSTQKAELFELMKDDLVNAVGSDRRLLNNFLEDFAADLGSLMLEAIDENLPAIIKSSADLVCFINKRPIEKTIILLDFIANKQPNLIESTHYVANVLHELSPEQCRLVCQSMRSLWPALIKSGQDFAEVLEHLNVEQRIAVYEAMTRELPRLIQSGQDLGDVLQYLEPEQRTVLYEGMKENWPHLIRTGRDYAVVIEHLDAEQRREVYEAVKSRLFEMIKLGNDLFEFVAVIEPEDRSAVFELMRRELPTLIQTGEQLSNLMRLLPERHVELLTLMGSRLPNILRSAWDTGYLLRVLPDDSQAIYPLIKMKLPELIRSISDLEVFLGTLNIEQGHALYDDIKARLPGMLGAKAFPEHLLKYLPEHQQALVKGLPEFISVLTKLTNQQEVVIALASAVLAVDVEGIKQHFNTLLQPKIKASSLTGRLFELKQWTQASVLSREQLMSSVDPMWRINIEGATTRYETTLSAERDTGLLGAYSPR